MITEIRASFLPTKEEGCIDCGCHLIISDDRTGDRICDWCGVVQEGKIMINEVSNL